MVLHALYPLMACMYLGIGVLVDIYFLMSDHYKPNFVDFFYCLFFWPVAIATYLVTSIFKWVFHR